MPRGNTEDTGPLTKAQLGTYARCEALVRRFAALMGYRVEIREYFRTERIDGEARTYDYFARVYIWFGEGLAFNFSFAKVTSEKRLPVAWYNALNEIAAGDLCRNHGWTDLGKCRSLDEFDLKLTAAGG